MPWQGSVARYTGSSKEVRSEKGFAQRIQRLPVLNEALREQEEDSDCLANENEGLRNEQSR
jgi:hypothetical protein